MSLSFIMNHFSKATAMFGSDFLFADSGRPGKTPKRNGDSVSSLWIASVGAGALIASYLGWKYITPPIKSVERTCCGCQATVSKSDRYCAFCGTAAASAPDTSGRNGGVDVNNNSNNITHTTEASATSCVYCHAPLASNEDATSCTDCGKPVPHQVLFDGPSLAPLSPSSSGSESPSESRTRQQEELPSANSFVAHDRIRQVPPPAAATVPQCEYQQQPPQVHPGSVALSPTMVTTEAMDDQLHIPLVHAEMASVPLVHAIAVDSRTVFPHYYDPIMMSDYNASVDNTHGESLQYRDRRSRNFIPIHHHQHASLVQQHAPLMNELRGVIASLQRPALPLPNDDSNNRDITSNHQQDSSSAPAFSNSNTNSRASRVLAAYRLNNSTQTRQGETNSSSTATTTNRRNPGSPYSYRNRRASCPTASSINTPPAVWQRQKEEWCQTRRQRRRRQSHQHCHNNNNNNAKSNNDSNSNNINADSHYRNSYDSNDRDAAN